MDGVPLEAGPVEGKTDGEGAYRFDLQLPAHFAGGPGSQGAARVLVEATVKDSAGHSESRGEPIAVSESPLIVTAVPEGGMLIPGIENQVFILTSYADGKPAVTDVRVYAGGNDDQTATTDAGGVAVVRLKTVADWIGVRVEASDKQGNSAVATPLLQTREGKDQILLRTERAVYRGGERISLRVFSTKERGTAYVDVVREGQTVVTRDLDIVGGQAALDLTASPDMAGMLDIDAYLFGRDALPVADHRLVFVQPADDLKIEATSNAAVYKPGGDARVNFRVTNSRGEGVQAALGLQVVDEAVFALAEKQPGFAKVFFYLEREAMKPRYEIHSIGMREVVETVPVARMEQRDRAARALFSATEMVNTNQSETEFGRAVPMTKRAQYLQRYGTRFMEQAQEAATRVAAGGAPGVRDAWGREIRVRHTPNDHWYYVQSPGPDGVFNTEDDLQVPLMIRTRKIVGRPTTGENAIDIHTETGRGPNDGLAEITGTVVDQNGAAMQWVAVQVTPARGQWRETHSDADGQFTLSSLAPGDYKVYVYLGFDDVTKKITLAERDRAVFSVYLRHEPAAIVVKDFEMVITGAQVYSAPAGAADGVDYGPTAAPLGVRLRAAAAGRTYEPPCRPRSRGRGSHGRARAHAIGERREIPGPARALLLSRGPLHQPRDPHRRARQRRHLHSAGRFHHHLAHGHGGLDGARRARQRYCGPQGLPGFLRRPRPAGHAHPGRPRVDSRGGL